MDFLGVVSLVVPCLGWGHRMTPKVQENPQTSPATMSW